MPRTKEGVNAAEAPCTRCGATPETGQRDDCPECQGIVPPAKESGDLLSECEDELRAQVREKKLLRDKLREAREEEQFLRGLLEEWRAPGEASDGLKRRTDRALRQSDPTKESGTVDTWSELCQATAALGVAWARFKLALDAHREDRPE